MASADYYADGQWNFNCDLCGRKAKSGQAQLTWDGFRVCSRHKEKRNPQDFLRGVKDNQTVPWSRPKPPEVFINHCTIRGGNAVPSYAVPGCCAPSAQNRIFIVEGLPEGDWVHSTAPLGIPSWAVPGYAVPGKIYRGGGDLDNVFDSMPVRIVRVQSKIAGHTSEYFLREVP